MVKECGANVILRGNRCYRCLHEWLSQDRKTPPKVCTKCKSPYWDRPRRIILPRRKKIKNRDKYKDNSSKDKK